MHNLLSRQADATFWLARQIERAGNTARLLDVTASFSRDGDDVQPWEAVLQLYSDHDRFESRHGDVTPEDVVFFYILDEDNTNSIRSNIRFARENARALRSLISTELWTHLNVFHQDLQKLSRRDLNAEKVSDLCGKIKQRCRTHFGLVDETMFRDEEWFFHGIGLNLERADQTTRLVDVKYHLLLPKNINVGSAVDAAQWNAVLRAAAGFQAFRRVHHTGLTGEKVAEFLLLDERYPRSVANAVKSAEQYLLHLRERFGLPSIDECLSIAEGLRTRVQEAAMSDIIANGMHEWIDDVQLNLMGLTKCMGYTFFGYELETEISLQEAA